MKSTYTIILVLFLPFLALGVTKDRRSKQVLEFFTKLEQGLFGEKDFEKATKLLRRSEGVERSWLVMALAKYQRAMVKDPVEGLRLLAPEILPASKAKAWLTQLKTAEKTRKAKWVQAKADAYRNKQPAPLAPSGIAVGFPEISEFHVQESKAQVALEVARCLMCLGKVDKALAVIDHYGHNFQADGRVLAFECLGDLYLRMQLFEKAVNAYKAGSRLLMANKPTEGLSKWQEIMRRRLAAKLAEAQKRWDVDRYGPGYVAFRAAEIKRLKDEEWLAAIWLYDQIIKTYPKSVYSEASQCRKLECLLELATRKYPSKAERRTLKEAETKVKKEKNFHKVAKRCKVPQASLDEIQATIAKLEEKLRALKTIPYSNRALEMAKDIAKTAIEEDRFALYRGEMLVLLGDALLEDRLDSEGASAHYQKAISWLASVSTATQVLSTYRVPARATRVSKPPASEKKTTGWSGWVVQNRIEPGKVLNRLTSAWYLDSLRARSHRMLSLCCFIGGDVGGALKQAKLLLKYEPMERKLHSEKKPNSYSRLLAGYRDGWLRCSREELKLFAGILRVAVLLGDFYYEIEDLANCEKIRRRIAQGFYGKLSTQQEASAKYQLADVLYRAGKDKQTHQLLEELSDEKFRKTYSAPNVLIAVGNLLNQKNDRKSIIKSAHYYRQAAKIAGPPIQERALYYEAHAWKRLGLKKEAKDAYQRLLTKYPKSRFRDLVIDDIKQMEKKQ